MANPKGNPETLKPFKPKWRSGKTRTIRVPIAIADRVLEAAKLIDANPDLSLVTLIRGMQKECKELDEKNKELLAKLNNSRRNFDVDKDFRLGEVHTKEDKEKYERYKQEREELVEIWNLSEYGDRMITTKPRWEAEAIVIEENKLIRDNSKFVIRDRENLKSFSLTEAWKYAQENGYTATKETFRKQFVKRHTFQGFKRITNPECRGYLYVKV